MQITPTITDVQFLDAMESQLGRLAARWRGAHTSQEEKEIVRHYQSVLRCMIELGYHASLDTDAELPDELMPQEYLALFNNA